MSTRVWCIGDTHFRHEKIIKLCNRPFSSADEMNEALVNNWNAVVQPKDTVIHVGDFGYGNREDLLPIFSVLNGRKILIEGNHDDRGVFSLAWHAIYKYYDMKWDGRHYVFFHYPMEDWNRRYRGSVHYHGHVHNTPVASIENRINVSVEMIDYTPVLVCE